MFRGPTQSNRTTGVRVGTCYDVNQWTSVYGTLTSFHPYPINGFPFRSTTRVFPLTYTPSRLASTDGMGRSVLTYILGPNARSGRDVRV